MFPRAGAWPLPEPGTNLPSLFPPARRWNLSHPAPAPNRRWPGPRLLRAHSVRIDTGAAPYALAERADWLPPWFFLAPERALSAPYREAWRYVARGPVPSTGGFQPNPPLLNRCAPLRIHSAWPP